MLYKELLHSIPQVWVGAIARGPNGQQLLGNYHTSEQLTYQDDVGHLVRDVCATIPHGVLCFFPSYKSLEKICNRWKVRRSLHRGGRSLHRGGRSLHGEVDLYTGEVDLYRGEVDIYIGEVDIYIGEVDLYTGR